MKIKKRFLTVIFLMAFAALVITVSCGKNDSPPIEIGYVNFQIYPNSTEYLPLNSVGGYAYVTENEPSRGIIIYRLSTDEFRAYERTPTYKPDSCCIYGDNYTQCTRLIVDESAFFALDTCAGSKYLLIDGSIVEGPAAYPMVQYNTRYDGETLFVFN
jgi:hypothetical protein